MTADELRAKFNNEFGFGLEKTWPKTYEVDHETYANCCQAVFDWKEQRCSEYYGNEKGIIAILRLAIGPNNGLMFKNVELILKSRGMMK